VHQLFPKFWISLLEHGIERASEDADWVEPLVEPLGDPLLRSTGGGRSEKGLFGGVGRNVGESLSY
jgi:hypothetical protein